MGRGGARGRSRGEYQVRNGGAQGEDWEGKSNNEKGSKRIPRSSVFLR